MASAASDRYVDAPRSPDRLIRDSLERIDELMAKSAVELLTVNCKRLCDELRQLHARFRMHDATCRLDPGECTAMLEQRPELASELRRVRDEHPHVLGLLDHLIRHVDSIVDQSAEDQEVFVLRLRELIAVFRRHEAEEDRIFHRAAWEETGGEGG